MGYPPFAAEKPRMPAPVRERQCRHGMAVLLSGKQFGHHCGDLGLVAVRKLEPLKEKRGRDGHKRLWGPPVAEDQSSIDQTDEHPVPGRPVKASDLGGFSCPQGAAD